MDCLEFRSLFSDYAEDELELADVIRCEDHLASCDACRQLEAAYRVGVSALRDLDPPTPARDLGVRVLHRARREPRLAILAGGYGLAAALLLVTLASVVAVDLHERESARRDVRVADTAVIAKAPVSRGLDVITIQVHDVPAYAQPVMPYVASPATDPDPAFRYQFEVPAVWSGR